MEGSFRSNENNEYVTGDDQTFKLYIALEKLQT